MRNLLKKTHRACLHFALPVLEQAGTPGFAGEVISLIAEKRKYKNVSVYFDTWRFPGGKPTSYDALQLFRFLKFLHTHADKLNEAAKLLDDSSRALLKTLLAYRALGPVHIALPESEKLLGLSQAAELLRTAPSLEIFPPFEMAHYGLIREGQKIEFESWAPLGLLAGQYYYSQNNHSVMPCTGDIVIDAGGCFGDTALAFAATVGPSGEVHVFEPMPRQLEVFRRNVERNPHVKDVIRIHPFGLGDTHGQKLRFKDSGAGARPSDNGTVEVSLTTIDHIVQQYPIQRIDFIKMDIEGAELSAIRGAQETIKKFHPKLAISIYHSNTDLFEIELTIKEICPDYNFFIGHYTAHTEETVLYGEPKSS